MLNCVLLTLLALTTAASAVPGVPTIQWADHNYALVEINHEASAYERLIATRKPSVDVKIEWDVYTGDVGDVAYLLFNDKLVWKGDGEKHQSATVAVDHGGVFNATVKLCNADGCSQSKPPVRIVVADTDGSHLFPLAYTYSENNAELPQQPADAIVAAYFVEWGVYGRQFPIDRVPAPNLSHLLYGFVPICGGDGVNDALKTIPGSFEALQRSCAGRADFKVAIHDPWAAVNKPQKGVSAWNEPYKGNFGQLMAAKLANPRLKVLPSIGGWTLSDPFFFMHDDSKRRTFVDSVVEFLQTWKFFDGVDIDWEFPGGKGANPNVGNPKLDGETYVALLRELRLALNKLGEKNNRQYLLTSAIGAGNDKIALVNYAQAQKYLNYIFVMTYDFKGAWSLNDLGHQTAVYAPKWRPHEPYTMDSAVSALMAQNVDAAKIVLGVAMYGRGWTGVSGGADGEPFSGRADGPVTGTWENGVVDYRDIVARIKRRAVDAFHDKTAVAAFAFNSTTGDLISYDSTKTVHEKARYVVDHKLGGLFAWEIDADNGDLLNAINIGLLSPFPSHHVHDEI